MAELHTVVDAFASLVQAMWNLGMTHWSDFASLILPLWAYLKTHKFSVRSFEVDIGKGTLTYQKH